MDMTRKVRRLTLAPLMVLVLVSGCTYTSNVVFPEKDKALYCFLDEAEDISYLYGISLFDRQLTLLAEFEQPVFSITLTNDRETLFYYQLNENVEGDSDEDMMDDTLDLKMIQIEDLSQPSEAATLCSFKVNRDAGIAFGSTFGAASIIPLLDRGAAILNYVEDEDVVKLVKVDFENGEIETISDKIAVYPQVSTIGRCLAYLAAAEAIGEEDGEEAEGFDCTVIVLDIDTLKPIEQKNIGRWKTPPRFAFRPDAAEGYEIFYPQHNEESLLPCPKGVSMKMHYLDSIACVAGTRRYLLYGHEKTLAEITNLECGIIETFDRKDFVPLAWSPDDAHVFLGRDEYLAQYVVGRKMFVLYEFSPPSGPGEAPDVFSSLVSELPDRERTTESDD
jgi:hypothetical protein